MKENNNNIKNTTKRTYSSYALELAHDFPRAAIFDDLRDLVKHHPLDFCISMSFNGAQKKT